MGLYGLKLTLENQIEAMKRYLELCVEVNAGLAVEVVAGADVGGLVTGEGEHGEWDWDGDVDADLAGLDLVGEATGGGAVGGETGGTVTPGVGVDQVNRLVKGLYLHSYQDGAKDLLLVASHVGLGASDDSWTDKVATFVA